MDKQQLIKQLVDDLATLLKAKFDSVAYDEAYRNIVGRDRDPMLKAGEMQLAAGAIFMGTYFVKCCEENPEFRLTPSLGEIVPVADMEIVGFALQGNMVMQLLSKWMSDGTFFTTVNSLPEWRNSPPTVKKRMASRINALTILAIKLIQSSVHHTPQEVTQENAIKLGATFNDVFDAFMKKYETFLDQAYGAYVPPPPPPKKGFWASIFG